MAPDDLSVRRCCELLGVNRSTLYYQGKPVDVNDIDLLNIIRDIWEQYPFYGYRRITRELRENKGIKVNRKRVQRLMVWGGIQGIHPGPNTSKRNKLHAVHKYLLRDVNITRANQAWMIDITYLRMPKGFMYLVAIIDVFSRYIVGWSVSNTLETGFCIDALKSALTYATPEILNSDQGSQFTSDDWIQYLQEWDIKISMTGKGRCTDNIYIERFWRSFKSEEFYLNEYESVKELKKSINAYIEFYNRKRWHQSLGYKTPASIYFEQERKACGYVDESFGPANALRDVCTS
ncbi:MAG: IS3 family transposase [Gammaproteobacteria bacterium]|nr:IS3 family transposase [Gammaproteobacteria bacterium]